ncbi:MAG TPA: chromate efflux transporter [Myxococcales bacterium]|nr:chromate efflux transporter [Myxococcales bacterium]
MESHAGEASVVPAAPAPVPASGRRRPNLDELFRSSLFLGVIGFGGGLSVLASIESHVVTRKRWLTDREFSNAVTVSQMLPGGAAANAIAYIGLRFGGWRGALLGYTGFCLPGLLAVLALGWAYTRFGTTPNADVVLGGFNAAVVGIIASITLKMVRTSVSRLWQMGVSAVALLFSAIGNAPPGEIVLGAIAVGLAVDLGTKRARLASVRRRRKSDADPPVALPEEGHTLPGDTPGPDASLKSPAILALCACVLAALHVTGVDANLVRFFLTFFRTGLGAYGGGFAIVPHLKQVIQARNWITEKEFAEAVAIGKLTPGPVLLLATFIGYLYNGFLGAMIATVGIFSAPFLLVVVAGTTLDRLRSRRFVRAGLRGLTPAVLGLMAAALIALGDTLNGEAEIGIAVAVALTLSRFPLNPALMLLVGGVFRFLLKMGGL